MRIDATGSAPEVYKPGLEGHPPTCEERQAENNHDKCKVALGSLVIYYYFK